MKKILFALLSCITLALPASGAMRTLDSVIVEAPVLEYAAKAFFKTEDSRKQVLQKYRDLLGTGAAGLNAQNAWDVCAAGVDIKSADGRKQCTDFISYVTRYNNKYYDVCDNFSSIPSKYQSGSRCEKDFFNWTNVQMLSAVALAQEYAKIKWNEDIICSNEYREYGNDDWVQCRSLKSGVFFEFKFDDVRESKDVDIQTDIRIALCKMHGGKSDEDTNGYHCKISTSICTSKLADSTKRFGGKAYYDTKKDVCLIEYNTVNSKDGLKTACGINNFMYCRGIQVDTTVGLQGMLKQKVAKDCKIDVSQVRCDNTFKTYKGEGCNVSTFAPKDDIISCYYGSEQIDFVFDDVNELNKTYANAGKQGVLCLNSDGSFDGKNCVALDKASCDIMISQSKNTCPECKSIYWDTEKGLCVIPDAVTATNLEKGLKVTGVIVTVVAGVALGVVTGGAATGVLVVVGNSLLIGGGAAVITSEIVIQSTVWRNFVEKAQKCIIDKDAKCAEDLVKNELNRMMSYSNELTDAEAASLDEVMYKLVDMIPDDSSFWTEFFGNPEFFDCDPSGENCTVKESAQLWQIVRTAGNVAMIAGGLLNMVAHFRTAFKKTSELIKVRVTQHPSAKTELGQLSYVTMTGGRGLVVSNKEIVLLAKEFGMSGIAKNSEFVKAMGWKVGQEIWFNPVTRQFVTSVGGMSLNGLIPMAVGAGHELYHMSKDGPFFLSRPKAKDETPIEPVKTVAPVVPVEPVTPTITPKPETPAPVVTPTAPTVTPEPETPAPVVTPTAPTVTPTVPTAPVSVAPIEPLKNIEPVKTEKKRNTAAIAIGSVLAVGATGGLVGGLVAKNKRDERREANKLTTVPVATPFVGAGNQLTNEMNALLGTAGGVLGYVNGKELKLIPLPTVVNTYSTIVQINVRAVAVVDYNGYKLPYYVEPTAGSWRPLLGIGQMGGWFNTYPSDTGITTIDSITNTLNQILAPANVSKFVGGAAGSAFPVAAPAAYQIINAEFPNGVVQTYNGTFTPADQALYNSNYNKMKNAL